MDLNLNTVKQLHAIAETRGLTGYSKLRKVDLVALLDTSSGPAPAPFSPEAMNVFEREEMAKTGPIKSKIEPNVPSLEAMNVFEREEMAKTRPIVKSKLRELSEWLLSHVPESIKGPVRQTFASVKNRILSLYHGARKTLLGEIEEEANEDHAEDDQKEHDFTPKEHKHSLHKTFRSYRITGIDGTDNNGYLDMVRSHVKKLIENQVEEMGSAKIQCSLWILWRKPIDGTNEFIEVDKVFHSNMTSVFQGTIVDEVMDMMFAQIRTHVENPALPKSGFSIGRIQHLDVDFHKLKLTRGLSYIETQKWIATKKAIINPNNNDEECFRWALVAALHHEDIAKDPQRISKLRPYIDRYNWQGIEFPTSIKDINKFERNNPDIAVNVLYVTGRSFNILRRSTFNERKRQQANLLLLTDEKKNHYVAIKNLSRLLGSEISKNHGKMNFCMNCLEGFQTVTITTISS
ncbi:uncharacterized protein LOC130646281 [Hydractinia symbiolongicarpus]|uniref:uncharacterized protein LOC130646281 n=1 Tax=Hydractinia symbiolongicarpus TaxID=13093 RepID=UPI00254EC356|nr:uncharacterized protein LOC130646281 [Hydractinia symbiolongicarpus]